MIINKSLTKHYNDMLYDSRPVKFSEYMTNKYNVIHTKIYQNSLNAFINDWLLTKKKLANERSKYVTEESYLEMCKNYVAQHPNMKYSCGRYVFAPESLNDFKRHSFIYEIMPAEYWQPSKIKIVTKYISLDSPNLTWEVNLLEYWNMYQAKFTKTIDTKKLKQDPILDAKLTGIDYLRGKAKMYSKQEDLEYEVDFDYLDDGVDVSEDYLLSETFMAKYQH